MANFAQKGTNSHSICDFSVPNNEESKQQSTKLRLGNENCQDQAETCEILSEAEAQNDAMATLTKQI